MTEAAWDGPAALVIAGLRRKHAERGQPCAIAGSSAGRPLAAPGACVAGTNWDT